MEFFKKAGIGIVLGLMALFLVFFGLNKLDKDYTTRIETITVDQTITINSEQLAASTFSVSPYQTTDVFISEEQSPDFEFTSVGGSWEEIKPNGTNVDIEVRFKSGNEWSEWLEVEEEEDIFQEGKLHENSVKRYGMASSDGATAMQYKVLMYGDGVNVPMVENMQWTFIKAAKSVPGINTPKPQYSSNSGVTASTYIALNSNNQKTVISRSQWGADESYRYLEDNSIDPVLVEIDAAYYEKFKDELQYSRVVESDENGDKYKWPLQYPTKVKKVIIHHTATTENLDSPEQAIRDIYYYHAISRGWGDIGYNYIVDQEGNIYEGRYGGEGVIGAHSGPGNNGSIGIAVLGNYEETDVNEEVVGAIGQFVAQKSKVHDIDPEGYSAFRAELMPNIFGHKDIMSTQCPGIYLYQKLPIIRSLAKELKQNEKEKFIKDYDYQDLSEIYYIEMKPKDTIEVTMKMENIGKVDWNSETFLVVNQNPDFEGFISFPSAQNYVLTYMEEDSVAPGETATFKFQVKSGAKGDIVYMEVAPVMNGTQKPFDSVVVPIAVQQTDYRYEFADSKFPPDAVEKGQTFEGFVKLKNTGNVTWTQFGENMVVLGADHPQNRLSEFTSPKSNVLGTLEEEEVKPGEIGTFKLSLTAPDESGYYKEYFTPRVVGEDMWMADHGLYFETTVFGDLYEAEHTDTLASQDWKVGKKYLVILKFRNVGQVAWNRDNFTVGFLKDQDLKITDTKLENEKDVKPGEIATLTFVAEVLTTETPGIKPILTVPKVDGTKLFNRPIYTHYNVVENGELSPEEVVAKLKENLENIKKEQEKVQEDSVQKGDGEVGQGNGDEEDIRVKLSFSGNPEITADSDFEIYSGDTLLESLSSGEIAKVEYSASQYLVTTPKNTYKKSDPIRFVPKGGGIMEIDNYDHSPAWNQDLNDNEYRGVLEVRKVDSTLVVINELPLEDYLKGLGEVSNTSNLEKIKSIMVAARSYALYYITVDEKFPGKPYHLDDDPNVSQKYLGYGLEKRSPNVTKGVEATAGQVVTYDGEVVKTPYFNQSDGTKTKDAKDIWGWDLPYLVSVSDSYCNGETFLGHGVGLSGCGATGMAEAGFSYVEILQHYYTGVDITDLY